MARTRTSCSTVSADTRRAGGTSEPSCDWRQDQIDAIAGPDQAGKAGHRIDADGDGAHAGSEDRGQETAIAGIERIGRKHGLALGEVAPDQGPQQFAANGFRVDLPAGGNVLCRPLLDSQVLGLQERAGTQRLGGNQERYLVIWRSRLGRRWRGCGVQIDPGDDAEAGQTDPHQHKQRRCARTS